MNGQEPPHTLKQPVSEEDWTRGPADAAVTLVEYAGFQCPDCQRAYPVLQAVLAALRGHLRFVLRHFPLVSIHSRAQAAALAAEAAGRQGRFWEMHDRLMEARGALEEADLARYAEELGLDRERFDRDRHDPALEAKLRQQKLLGVRSGVNGTPTLFINGLRYEGPTIPLSETALLAALAAAEADLRR